MLCVNCIETAVQCWVVLGWLLFYFSCDVHFAIWNCWFFNIVEFSRAEFFGLLCDKEKRNNIMCVDIDDTAWAATSCFWGEVLLQVGSLYIFYHGCYKNNNQPVRGCHSPTGDASQQIFVLLVTFSWFSFFWWFFITTSGKIKIRINLFVCIGWHRLIVCILSPCEFCNC